MSITTEKTDSATPQIWATLVRGRVYFLRKREFLAGVPQQISEEEKEWLEAHAFDQISLEGENEFENRCKFKFTTENPADGAPAPRTRARR